jgi:putative transposase
MLVKKLKGRTSHHLQQDYPELRKRYWGQHFWAVGYGAWSTDNIIEAMIQEYLDHHNETSNAPSQNWILEKD